MDRNLVSKEHPGRDVLDITIGEGGRKIARVESGRIVLRFGIGEIVSIAELKQLAKLAEEYIQKRAT